MEPYNYCKCGTMGYTAPEVLLTDSMFYKSYGYKCDIFSFGVVAHMLLMGNNPLAGKSDLQRKNNIHVELKEEEII
jgi:serine/threonine protein kinase